MGWAWEEPVHANRGRRQFSMGMGFMSKGSVPFLLFLVKKGVHSPHF